MIDTDKYEGQIEFDDVLREIEVGVDISEGNYDILRYYRDEYKDLLAEVKRLRDGIRGILSDYDITELIRDVPEDEWNFEQQALIRMKEMIE